MPRFRIYDLPLPDPPPEGADWIEAFRRWAREKIAYAQPASAIDRDKLRAAVRKLGNEYVFYMLDEAIDLLPRPSS